MSRSSGGDSGGHIDVEVVAITKPAEKEMETAESQVQTIYRAPASTEAAATCGESSQDISPEEQADCAVGPASSFGQRYARLIWPLQAALYAVGGSTAVLLTSGEVWHALLLAGLSPLAMFSFTHKDLAGLNFLRLPAWARYDYSHIAVLCAPPPLLLPGSRGAVPHSSESRPLLCFREQIGRCSCASPCVTRKLPPSRRMQTYRPARSLPYWFAPDPTHPRPGPHPPPARLRL